MTKKKRKIRSTDHGAPERAQHSRLVVERQLETDDQGRTTGVVTRLRDPYPTALHRIVAKHPKLFDDAMFRAGQRLGELWMSAGMTLRLRPLGESVGGSDMTDDRAESLALLQAALNSIGLHQVVAVVRNVCCCDQDDDRAALLRIGLLQVARHWGYANAA